MNKPSDTTQVHPETVIVRDNLVPPAVGRMVDYVLSESDSPVAAGEVRPAVIVTVEHGQASLAVFTRGGRDQMQSVHHVPSVQHLEPSDGAKLDGTWHWPPARQLVFHGVQLQAAPSSEELPTDAPPPDSEPYVGNPPEAFAKVPTEPETQDPLPSSQEGLPFPESKP